MNLKLSGNELFSIQEIVDRNMAGIRGEAGVSMMKCGRETW